MRPWQYTIITISALLSIIAAGLVHSVYSTKTTENVKGEKLLPDFDRYADNISSIVIQSGETILTLIKKKEGTWRLSERDFYPVQHKKVYALLNQIANAELIETKTRNPELFKLLEVEDPSKENVNSKRIRLLDEKGYTLSDIVLGKLRYSAFGRDKSGTYVRRFSDTQTWLTNTIIQIPLDIPEWVNSKFLNLPANKINLVTLTPPNGQIIKLIREEQDKLLSTGEDKKNNTGVVNNKFEDYKFLFKSIPKGQKIKEEVDASQLVTALETLRLRDVRKASETKFQKDTKTYKVYIETEDLMKVSVKLSELEKKEYWLSVEMHEDGKDKEIANLMKISTEGWEFKISPWQVESIFKNTTDVFENETKKVKTN
ncbi:MAG: hypothetical protein TECD_00835 [Hyphomicrobiaceae bacterium hypho_1]